MKPLQSLIATFVARDVPWHITLAHDWSAIMGDLAQHMRCEKVEGSCVVIGVYDPRWMQELYCMQQVIMQRINHYLKAPHVQHLRFGLARGDNKPQHKANNRPQRALHVKKQSRLLSAREQRALEKITDEQLREALAQFLIRCDP